MDSINSLDFLQTTRSVKKLLQEFAKKQKPVVVLADEPDVVDPPIVKKREWNIFRSRRGQEES
jgi:hypothetical protein